LFDPSNPEDLNKVHAPQDAMTVSQPGGPGRFEIPARDPVSQKKVREALLILASTLTDTNRMYGRKEDVDPVRFIIGAAMGWGANPPKEALYLNESPSKNNGATIYKLHVKDVPVDGFRSVSVYNVDGYFQ
jgi:hypothetical protein